MNNDTVIDYFSKKASSYDSVDEQIYWKLSDELLRFLFKTHVLPILPNKPRIMDAGAGTGRWSLFLAHNTVDSQILMLDLTKEMLDEAITKIEYHNLTDRFESRIADLNELKQVKPKSDLIICLHNVLSFVKDPKAVISMFLESLNPGGQLVLVIPNKYHACYFSLKTGQIDEFKRVINNDQVKFNSDCPEMHVFTPDMIEDFISEYQNCEMITRGFPTTIYPGMEETFLFGQNENIVNILNTNNFNLILEAEKSLCSNSKSTLRGNNLFIQIVKN